MKKTRFTEAQTVAILGELDAGVPVAGLAGEHGVHANTDPALARQVRWHGNQRFSEA